MASTHIQAEALRQKIRQGETFLVDFRAPWCPHCRRLEPTFEALAEEYGDRLPFVQLNMDEDEGLWEEMELELIPTLRLYHHGQAVDTVVNPPSREAVEEFLQKNLPQEKEEAPEQLYDTVVIGGGPGGYTAALYAARAGLNTLIVEKLSAGGQMAQSTQIDNYPGFEEGIDGFELAQRMQRQAERFGAATLNAEVLKVDLTASPKMVETASGKLYANTVILATGANPRELGIEGEEDLIGHGVAYCATCDGMFYRGKTVVVVGGGNSAAADALHLSRIAKKVILVHRRDTLRATKIYHDPLMKAPNVEFAWNSVVTELLHDDRLTGVRLRNTLTGEETILPTDGLFVSIGRKPASELAAGQLPLDPSGYIVADETTKTQIPGVYAVGDVRTKQLRQVVTAVSDGACAVESALEYLAETLGR